MNRLVFIEKARKRHGDKYNYSLVPVRIMSGDYVDIICSDHGTFNQRCANHLAGNGCPECAGLS